jgi:DNA repair exonuclease SbcCD ATPase subunit
LEKLARTSKRVSKVVALLKADNVFDEVLAEIEKMIALIGEEAKADAEQLSWCNSEREESHSNLADAKSQILTLEDEINTIDDTINNPESGLKAQLEETAEALNQNYNSQVSETKDRTEVNLAYQANIKNLVAAETIIKRATKVLVKYYDDLAKKLEEASLLQSHKGKKQAPPDATMNHEGQSDQGNQVIEMLTFILEETVKEENNAHTDENNAQHAYEDSMTDLKTQEADLQRQSAKLTKTLAEKEAELLKKREELAATEAEKKKLEDYLADIKPGCDFITKNFDDREANRATEQSALEKATTLIKETPVYKSAVAAQHQEDLGGCKDICNEVDEAHVKCKACLADVTVPAYCAGHKGTDGC